MGDELFDVVNEADVVTGRQPRSEVHRLGLRHRAVHILVFNEQGEIFLQKRSLTKDTSPGLWDSSAAGHLDAGESYDACAVRELREELGWRLEHAPERLFKLTASEETGQEFVWVYRLECNGPFALHPEEIETGAWFAPTHVDRWARESPWQLARALRLIWREWRSRGGAV